MGLQRMEQPLRGGLNFIDRAEERRLIGLGWTVKAAHLSYELQRGCADFVVGHRRIKIKERFDASAHAEIIGAGPIVCQAITPCAASAVRELCL
jgi:hypothetical protein